MKTCGCCQTSYEDENDLVLFGALRDANGKVWAICGPCVQAMWAERAPAVEPIV